MDTRHQSSPCIPSTLGAEPGNSSLSGICYVAKTVLCIEDSLEIKDTLPALEKLSGIQWLGECEKL